MIINRRRQSGLITIFILIVIGLALVAAGCQSDTPTSLDIMAADKSLPEATISLSSTILPVNEKSLTPTNTPPATITPFPTAEATVTSSPEPTKAVLRLDTPTATGTFAVIASETISINATVIAEKDQTDRTCPDPVPVKPDYKHFFLGGEIWSHPAENRSPHFWLTKPLPGGGRLLYTDWLPYGYDAGGRYLIHNGIDSAEPEGTPLLAVADGTVIVAGSDTTRLFGWRCNWYGNLVVVELDDPWLNQPVYVLYGHVLNISVVVGQRVERGDQIAEVGYGGAAQLAHLHFEVRIGTNLFGSTRNPLLWLAPPATRGVIVGRLVDPEGRPWQGVPVVVIGQSPDSETYRTWTYLDDPKHIIRPDELYAENFVIGDMLPGEYLVYVEIQDETYQIPVTVFGGSLSEVEIVTKPYNLVKNFEKRTRNNS